MLIKMMRFHYPLLLFLCIWGIECKSAASLVEYNVVVDSVIENSRMGVAIGQQVYPLQPHGNIPLLYSGTGPGGRSYRYVIVDSTMPTSMVDFEPFERPAILQSDRTFNEHYGRPWNKLSLPALHKAYEDIFPDEDESKLYEDGTIANLMFEFNPLDLDRLHSDKMNPLTKITGKMSYISYDNVQQFDEVSLKIGGHSSRTWAKVAYKLKLKSDDGLYDRKSLKLRPEATDPTLIREKLYSDLLHASGVHAPRGAYARIYFNNRPIGLYLIMDDNVDKQYVRQTIHQGKQNAEIGPIIKADAGKGEYPADLAYLGENAMQYDPLVYEVKSKTLEGKAEAIAGLIDLTRFISNFDKSAVANPGAVEQWQRVIHVDHFLRQAACEWLGGNWDGIVYSGNNYMLYKHPKTNQFITMPMDFDFTFGNGLEIDQRKLMTGNWTELSSRRMVHSYLWEKVMSVPEFQKRYMEILRTINDKVAHPQVLLPRVQGLAYMIQHDAEWDKRLPKQTNGGLSRSWPDGRFLHSLDRGSGAADENIGLIEWIHSKHQAVLQELTAFESLDPKTKEDRIHANAMSIEGIPRYVFEEMEEFVGEELGENLEDLVTAQSHIEIMPQVAANPLPQH